MQSKIVIIGTGWAGYTLTHDIDTKHHEVIVISPQPTTPYTPLLASAACGLFNFSLAEEPIRSKSRHVQFIQAYVKDIDFEKQTCTCQPAFDSLKDREFSVEYDKVVIAPGCQNQTFGTPGVAENALFVRNVNDAMKVQKRLQDIVEMASLPGISEEEQRALLHIVVVGGGPTGVEISAEMTDLIRDDFSVLYPNLKDKFSIAIHDVATQILSVFDKKLVEHAESNFKRSSVEIKTGSHITKVEPGVMTTKEDGPIRFGMLIWATGNKEVPLTETLKVSKGGRPLRILTNEYLHPMDPNGNAIKNAFAIGDAADVKGGELPTTAEVATQKASYVAKVLNSEHEKPFAYSPRALIAYTGHQDGVVAGRSDWTGQGAWLAWRSKNLSWSRSWRNKVLITMNWSLDYLFGKEIARA